MRIRRHFPKEIASSPNPTWKPGDKINSPVKAWRTIDIMSTSVRDRYELLVNTVIPRPIALLSTIGNDGSHNLAPVSSFNLVASEPMSVLFSLAIKRDGSKKDSLRNIQETSEFVVNTVSDWMIEAVVQCSGDYPYEINEMELVGLTGIPSQKVKPQRIAESAIQMECKLISCVDVGGGSVGSATVVIGEILLLHIAENAYVSGKLDFNVLNPISRLGGASYARIGETFEIARPKVISSE